MERMTSKEDLEVMKGLILAKIRYLFPHNSSLQEDDKENKRNLLESHIEKIEK